MLALKYGRTFQNNTAVFASVVLILEGYCLVHLHRVADFKFI